MSRVKQEIVGEAEHEGAKNQPNTEGHCHRYREWETGKTDKTAGRQLGTLEGSIADSLGA